MTDKTNCFIPGACAWGDCGNGHVTLNDYTITLPLGMCSYDGTHISNYSQPVYSPNSCHCHTSILNLIDSKQTTTILQGSNKYKSSICILSVYSIDSSAVKPCTSHNMKENLIW